MYSTCAVQAAQNDGVVQRLLERAQGSVAVVSHALDAEASGIGSASTAAAVAPAAALEALGAERTRHGWLLLPDAAGCGPIYLAVLHKRSSTDLRRTKINKYAGRGGASAGGGSGSGGAA